MKATGIVRRIDDLGRVVIHIKKAFARLGKCLPFLLSFLFYLFTLIQIN